MSAPEVIQLRNFPSVRFRRRVLKKSFAVNQEFLSRRYRAYDIRAANDRVCRESPDCRACSRFYVYLWNGSST